jgi:hypothetical protein
MKFEEPENSKSNENSHFRRHYIPLRFDRATFPLVAASLASSRNSLSAAPSAPRRFTEASPSSGVWLLARAA